LGEIMATCIEKLQQIGADTGFIHDVKLILT